MNNPHRTSNTSHEQPEFYRFSFSTLRGNVRLDRAKMGAILSDQAKSLEWRARETEKKGKVSKETLQELLDKLNTLVN